MKRRVIDTNGTETQLPKTKALCLPILKGIVWQNLKIVLKRKKANKKTQDGFIRLAFFIGATGFEPATSATPMQHSTKLSHAPNSKINISIFFSICQTHFMSICSCILGCGTKKKPQYFMRRRRLTGDIS